MHSGDLAIKISAAVIFFFIFVQKEFIIFKQVQVFLDTLMSGYDDLLRDYQDLLD